MEFKANCEKLEGSQMSPALAEFDVSSIEELQIGAEGVCLSSQRNCNACPIRRQPVILQPFGKDYQRAYLPNTSLDSVIAVITIKPIEE